MVQYNLSLLFVLLIIGFMFLSIYLSLYFIKQMKIQKIAKMEFKEEYRTYLYKTPHYKNLSGEDKEKIEHSILLFANTKEFVGISLEVSDEMKVIISFYACLLLLHIQTKNCYDNLQTIIIYPHAVATQKIQNNGGIFSNEQFFIEGQSSNDTVIIIWHEAKSEAYHLRHNNVIIHEFTHEIDFMDGEIDGVPPIEKSKYNEWTRILHKDFTALSKVAHKNRDWGKYKLLGSYASTNEAEFFAVATERFFEAPKSLKKHFPELYNELESFYKINTLELI